MPRQLVLIQGSTDGGDGGVRIPHPRDRRDVLLFARGRFAVTPARRFSVSARGIPIADPGAGQYLAKDNFYSVLPAGRPHPNLLRVPKYLQGKQARRGESLTRAAVCLITNNNLPCVRINVAVIHAA